MHPPSQTKVFPKMRGYCVLREVVKEDSRLLDVHFRTNCAQLNGTPNQLD
jgi:hypothetical protein